MGKIRKGDNVMLSSLGTICGSNTDGFHVNVKTLRGKCLGKGSSSRILVEFNQRSYYFHNGNGEGAEEHCFYVYPNELKKITNNKKGW